MQAGGLVGAKTLWQERGIATEQSGVKREELAETGVSLSGDLGRSEG